MSGVKIKICGLSRLEDIAFVNEAMPDYCGFIIEYPKSRRNVSADHVRRLREKLNPGIAPIGVFVDAPIPLVAGLLRDQTLTGAQLHGNESEEYITELQEQVGEALLWKAFQVNSRAEVLAAEQSTADCILLDSGQGSGKPFDWGLLSSVSRPFFLAGGLTPENLQQAIRQVHPFGVDISSGVETDGIKDKDKILAAVNAVRTI